MLTPRLFIAASLTAVSFASTPFTATAHERASPVRPARNYQVIELTLGGSNCAVRAINDGKAVGWASTPGDTARHAFVWTQRTGIVDIGTLGGSFAEASAVNGDRVVGASLIPGDAEFHAFSWTPTEGMQDLGTLGGSFSGASSVSGNRIVGQSATALEEIHGFAWTPGAAMADLGTLASGTESVASEIHRGLIAGWSATKGNLQRRPVVWLADGQLVDIVGEPFEEECFGFVRGEGQSTGVRNGVVTGYRLVAGTCLNRAFIWTESAGLMDLGVPSGFIESFGFDTDGRLVVGQVTSDDPAVRDHPFVWTERRGMVVIGPRSIQGFATHVTAGRVIGLLINPVANGPRTFLWTAARGMVDVTPRNFAEGARPAGIDAEGRIAVIDDQGDINFFRSAVLVPRRLAH